MPSRPLTPREIRMIKLSRHYYSIDVQDLLNKEISISDFIEEIEKGRVYVDIVVDELKAGTRIYSRNAILKGAGKVTEVMLDQTLSVILENNQKFDYNELDTLKDSTQDEIYRLLDPYNIIFSKNYNSSIVAQSLSTYRTVTGIPSQKYRILLSLIEV